MKELHVRLTLTDEALGMMPSDPDLHENYIASKAPDAKTMEEEIEAFGQDVMVERGVTIFPRLADGTPYYWDYQMKGFFKDAIGMLRRVPTSKCAKLKSYKKLIDGLLFVSPRKIPFELSDMMADCQRPLRAETPQGPRVAIAHSETVPEDSTLTMTIQLLDETLEPAVRECLDYGALRGIAQWRNSGKGRFTWEEL